MESNIIFENEHKIIKVNELNQRVYIIDRRSELLIGLDKSDFELACSTFLSFMGYEVKKPEPKLKPCPNPYCGKIPKPMVECIPERELYRIFCPGCSMRGAPKSKKLEAIEAWNVLPRKES